MPLGSLPIDDAATLFYELAAARGVPLDEESLPTVQAICRRLDGLPLAIELVTARLVVLPPEQLLAALDDGLALTMEGPVDLPHRQRTLHATLGWSYALLTESQRRLHGLLAVFAGGSTLEDARAVAGPGETFLADLEALVTGSLLRREVSDGLMRLSMLETVREDAIGRLAAAGTLAESRRLHADRFLAFAAEAEEGLAGAEQAGWLQRAEDELDNVRAALDWCLANGRVADALQAVSALGRFWRAHGHASEARRLLARGLDQAADLPADVRARALWTAAHEAMAQSDYAAAVPALEEALAIFRELGDSRHAVFALCELARVHTSRDELDRAYQAGEDALALAESVGDDRASSAALDTLAMVADYSGRHRLAQEYSERSLALRRSLGDAILITSSTNTLGLAAMRAGDLDAAERAFAECLELARGLGEQLYVAGALCALGEIALGRDLPDVAAERLVEALSLFRELGDERVCAECLHALGGVAAAVGRPLDAARLWGAADALRERSGARADAGGEGRRRALRGGRRRRGRRRCARARSRRRQPPRRRRARRPLALLEERAFGRLVSAPTGRFPKGASDGIRRRRQGREQVRGGLRGNLGGEPRQRDPGGRARVRRQARHDGSSITQIEVVTKGDPNIGSYRVVVRQPGS